MPACCKSRRSMRNARPTAEPACTGTGDGRRGEGHGGRSLRLTAYQYVWEHPGTDLDELLAKRKTLDSAMLDQCCNCFVSGLRDPIYSQQTHGIWPNAHAIEIPKTKSIEKKPCIIRVHRSMTAAWPGSCAVRPTTAGR